MKIVIIHLGNITELLPVSSVIKTIKNKYFDTNITLVSKYNVLYKYNILIDKSLSFDDFKNKEENYDLLINLYPYSSLFLKNLQKIPDYI